LRTIWYLPPALEVLFLAVYPPACWLSCPAMQSRTATHETLGAGGAAVVIVVLLEVVLGGALVVSVVGGAVVAGGALVVLVDATCPAVEGGALIVGLVVVAAAVGSAVLGGSLKVAANVTAITAAIALARIMTGDRRPRALARAGIRCRA
jgi:hypothetical protein